MKTILITGGTGSLGRKLVELLLKSAAHRIIVLSRDELKQFEMAQQFCGEGQGNRLRFFIGDVRDKDRLYRAFEGVDYIIHAAALKQVPACEYNPFEAVKTNIIGAQNVIEAAIDRGVKKVMAVSTDKAVQPLNLYGATKACAEKLFIAGNSYSGSKATRFSVVRYGNVVGSRGSVIPFFKGLAYRAQQMGKGVELPITDERMTRFWITLDDAAKFVFGCLNRMSGGEIFVPKLLSMKVLDLAEAVAPGCKKEIVGIRPGEKLHELLLTQDEARRAFGRVFDSKVDAGYYVIQPEFAWWTEDLEGGKELPQGFEYCSGTNDRWLSVEELRRLI